MTGAILSLGLVTHAHAVPIQDQVFTSPSSAQFGLPSTPSTYYQQGVTAGMSGLLSQIDLFFAKADGSSGSAPPAEVLFSLNVGAPWQYDANDFEKVLSFNLGQAAGVVQIDVSSANIFVSPGFEFTIGLQRTGSNAVVPWFTGSAIGAAYTGGYLWLNEYPGISPSLPGFDRMSDLNFVTWVDDRVTVPEPSGLMLLLLGLPGLRLVRTLRS